LGIVVGHSIVCRVVVGDSQNKDSWVVRSRWKSGNSDESLKI